MKGYKDNIEHITVTNKNFRQVLYTGNHLQLVAMSLPPQGEIGMEVHHDTDQFFRFDGGVGKVIIDGNEYGVADGDAVIVPAGAEHNVINTSDSEDLSLYTVYAPSHHKEGTVHATKADADAAEERGDEEFDGTTTE